MREQTIAIANKIGLHARPAALLVKTAAAFKSEVALIKDGKSVNAKSMLAVMSAGVKAGETVTIQVTGEDEEQALEAVVTLIQNGLNEGR